MKKQNQEEGQRKLFAKKDKIQKAKRRGIKKKFRKTHSALCSAGKTKEVSTLSFELAQGSDSISPNRSHAMGSKWGTGGLPAVQHLVVHIGPYATLAASDLWGPIPGSECCPGLEGSSGVMLGLTSCMAIMKIPARVRPIHNALQLVATSTVVASIVNWNLALVTFIP
ncbi:hypothetical protein VNO77_33881 [Canavalia gladiata]|uniref:Uncharacterized protein n=1 Tax=Canavalia gladiata TaxID=3824 RepID=A0AAN9KCP0_CANGL